MCGIVGIAGPRPSADRAVLEVMRDTLRHRGPDDAGLAWLEEGRVALAHRRLAIIDLSPAGHQPMSDPEQALWIVFNGEIYNFLELRAELEGLGHRFRSTSDTEVILEAYRAWGESCIQRLNGMFALALCDLQAGKLLLARDRAGEKPLFYRHAGGRLVFASELKALMAQPDFDRRLDRQALDHYLAYGYVPAPMCILQGVRKLEAGQLMLYDFRRDRLDLRPYWRLPDPQPAGSADDPVELTDRLETLLRDSVRARLIADVPVGVLLSGGLDSSLITALAAQVSSKPVRTFTICFPGHGTFDEGPYARLVADHFGTQHTDLAAEPASVDLLPELARQFDEPIADHSMLPTFLLSRMIRQHCTVALGGDGGDELFGGYPHYGWLERLERWRRRIPGPIRRAGGWLAQRLPTGIRGRNHAIALGGSRADSIAAVNLYFDRRTRGRLLRPLGVSDAWQAPELARAALCDDRLSLLQQATAMDFRTYLAEDILVKVDRSSMLTSLEVRAPWLDHRIIELAFGGLSDRYRSAGAEQKVLPRLLGRRLLPPTLDLRRKQGFFLPLAAWFRGAWGSFVQDVLGGADPGLFDPAVIREVLRGQDKGRSNTARLYALSFFELWRREYRVSS